MAKTWYEKYGTYEEVVTASDTAITAYAGGGQANATSLTSKFNHVSTCATNYDSVKLVAAKVGKKQYVYNTAAQVVAVYPQSGETIHLEANAYVGVYYGECIAFECFEDGKWTMTSDRSVIKSFSYIVGVYGVSGCNDNFSNAANHLEESLEVITLPYFASIIKAGIYCIDGLNGAATATTNLGYGAGVANILSGAADDTDEWTMRSADLDTTAAGANKTVYIDVDPNTNWSSLTNGKWKVVVVWIDMRNA